MLGDRRYAFADRKATDPFPSLSLRPELVQSSSSELSAAKALMRCYSEKCSELRHEFIVAHNRQRKRAEEMLSALSCSANEQGWPALSSFRHIITPGGRMSSKQADDAVSDVVKTLLTSKDEMERMQRVAAEGVLGTLLPLITSSALLQLSCDSVQISWPFSLTCSFGSQQWMLF